MGELLRILILEDQPADAELVTRELRKAGLDFVAKTVTTEKEFLAELRTGAPQLILADYSLPGYDGLSALAAAQKLCPQTPFVFVSGSMGEEKAVETLHRGATDCVLKQRLARLGPAVRRALREGEGMRKREQAERERQQAEESLRESERRYRLLFNSGYDAVFVHQGGSAGNDSGKFIEVNDVACQRLGYTRGELLQMTPREISAPEPLRGVPGIGATLAARTSAVSEGVHIAKDGRRIPVEISTHVFDLNGQPTRLSMVRDITQRKDAEARLHLLSEALESAANAIMITDRDGTINWANAAFTVVSGYPLEEALGQKPSLFKSGAHDTAFYQNLWKTILAGRVWSAEMTNRRKDGSLYTEETTITQVRNEKGEISHFIAVKQDITERKALDERLRQSQKMEAVGQLAGGVAHDFNNMLAVIQGNAELLLMDETQLTVRTREGLKHVVEVSQRAANLTRQLLALSRKQVLQPQPLLLNEVIANLTKMLNRVISENIDLQCHYAAALPYVQADIGMMEQVILNLVVNARDAMPRGGQLRVATEQIKLDEAHARTHPEARAGEFICLLVSDTGTGIAPEVLPRIFEPFFTTKEVGKGTGLGLATVYGIVQQHQGWIEVCSQVGKGSTFKVILPAIPNPAQPTAATAASADLPSGTETILLVEDEHGVRMATRRVLESKGYKIREAANAQEALAVWQSHAEEIALLLTDIIMPGEMTGRDLAERLWAQRPGLKVIFMSGYSGEVIGKNPEFIQRTNSHFLQKPCSSRILLETMRRCLDGKDPVAASGEADHAIIPSGLA